MQTRTRRSPINQIGWSLRHTMGFTLCVLAIASCTEHDGATEPVTESGQRETTGVASVTNGWTAKTAMPTGRFGLAVAVLYNPLHQPTLYAVGGIDADGGLLATVEAYDFATNSWNTKAPFPSYGIAPLATVLQSTIYLAVGNAFFVYDLVADSWRLKAYAPPGLGFGSFGQIGAINGQIYVLEAGNRSFYSFDPSKDTWTVLPKCPIAHSHGAAAVVGGKFYVAGGVRYTPDDVVAIRRLHVYDPVANVWSEKAPMPHGVSSAAGVRLNGQFYVLGGSTRFGRDYVQAYNPVSNTWVLKTPLPTWRSDLAAANFVNANGQQRIVAVGGRGGLAELGDRYLRSNDVYTP